MLQLTLPGNAVHAQPAVLPPQLPPLRPDLQLHEAAANPDGSPSWTIQDPVTNAFYRIGWVDFELLARWHLGEPQAVLASAAAETLVRPTTEELGNLLGFLAENHLLSLHSAAYTTALLAQHRRGRLSALNWLLHHYLFFRIPLWRPDLWLQRALPWVDWIYSRSFLLAMLAITVLALVLTGRQIDLFAASFMDTLTPGGLLAYFTALAVAKSLHELGHAFTATRNGVRVAHMGVAFLVLWPMLYTDTGESWRLRDRRQRLAIASAGILTELGLAALATLAWNLADPGDLRQALFFLAVTSWLISLALNASPFMRFDGYFILSDLVDVPNLHERSFALARTWLRRALLGWNEAWPEACPPRRRRLFIAFALATWLYRLSVFIGIAVLVYYMFFKLLGILLFLVEIGWFVVRPIRKELGIWQARRAETRGNRKLLALLALGALLLIATVPWGGSVTAQGWAHAGDSQVIYSPLPARVGSIATRGGPVQAGAVVLVLEQPESRMRERVAEAGRAALDSQLTGLAGLPDGEARRATLEGQRALRQAEASAARTESRRLELRAPVAGQLADIDPDLQPGVWVGPQQPLAVVLDGSAWVAEAFIGQHERDRVAVGNAVRFYPADDALHPLEGTVSEIDESRVAQLPHPLLSARHGGTIAVLQDAQGMTPRDPLYRVRIRLAAAPDRLAVRRGSVLIEATPRSLLADTARSLYAAAVREATF